jgi:tripartite ATP-independent transporter DctM subunit
MGPVLGVSVLQLYAAAFGPGFLLAGMYMVYTMVRSHLNPRLGPPVPKEERVHSIGTILWECLVGMVPVSVLTIATLGVILAGITTSTEAAAMGAAGAIALVLGYGRFTWRGLFSACQSTLATTSMVLFLAVASNVFGAVFARLGTATWITNTLLAVPLPAWGTISLVLFLIFLLGWPFEWPAIVLIFLPMLAPVATGLGYDMVWFGTIVAVVLQTAFLSPPVAMSAYYLKQVVKDWSMRDIYRGMYDFMVIQVLCVALVLAFPQIAMWFPEWLAAGDRLATPLQKDDGDPAAARNALEAGDALTNDAAGATTAEPEK